MDHGLRRIEIKFVWNENFRLQKEYLKLELSLKDLEIRNAVGCEALEKYWPKLENLIIDKIDCHLAKFIPTNQMTHLTITSQKNVGELLALISKEKLCLPDLDLTLNLRQPGEMVNVRFEKLKGLTINNSNQKLNIHVQELEVLSFGWSMFTNSHDWMFQLIKNVRKVKQIQLRGKWKRDSVAALYIDAIKKVPGLHTIELRMIITPEQIAAIITGCTSLYRLRFYPPNDVDYALMQNILKTIRRASIKNWQLEKSYDENLFTFITLNAIHQSIL